MNSKLKFGLITMIILGTLTWLGVSGVNETATYYVTVDELTGRDPLPDTFRDRAQALCDGRLRSDGVFEAKKIQAKCASKYEVDPTKGAQPVYQAEPENTASL